MSASGWIGVDLDGTLAHYEGWDGGKIGAPIPLMLERVKRWRSEEIEVRIFTARVYPLDFVRPDDDYSSFVGATDREEEAVISVRTIQEWCREHLGEQLAITCKKDFQMIELWDDRAISVKQNTGLVLGGTGRYPDMKSHEGDEGELRMALGIENGIVKLDFSKETGWIGFDKGSAIQLAAGLVKWAQMLP